MLTTHAMAIVLIILLCGLALFLIAMRLAQKFLRKDISTRSIFKGFGQKMWMTTCLGVLFFGVYLSIVYGLSLIADPIFRLNFFSMVHQHPIVFIYLGLLVFACFSVGIYIARIAIKYFYNQRY